MTTELLDITRPESGFSSAPLTEVVALGYSCTLDELELDELDSRERTEGQARLQVPPPTALFVSRDLSSWASTDDLPDEAHEELLRLPLAADHLCGVTASKLTPRAPSVSPAGGQMTETTFGVRFGSNRTAVGTTRRELIAVTDGTSGMSVLSDDRAVAGAVTLSDGRLLVAGPQGQLFFVSESGDVESFMEGALPGSRARLAIAGDVRGPGDAEIYGMGDDGTLATFDGTAWTVLAGPTHLSKFFPRPAIFRTGPGEAVAIGVGAGTSSVSFVRGSSVEHVALPGGSIFALAELPGEGFVVAATNGVFRLVDRSFVPMGDTVGLRGVILAVVPMETGFSYAELHDRFRFGYGYFHPASGFCTDESFRPTGELREIVPTPLGLLVITKTWSPERGHEFRATPYEQTSSPPRCLLGH